MRSKNLEQGNLLSQKVSPKTRFFFCLFARGRAFKFGILAFNYGVGMGVIELEFPYAGTCFRKIPYRRPLGLGPSGCT